jgi:BirA family biotin operon repressor/biotin-[acetyl-CoA-carboxylase] ligase
MASLDLAALRAALGATAEQFAIDWLPSCDSTNTQLLARAEAGAASGTVIVAATQTAGRGRRGRGWLAEPGDSLTFSLLWRFAPGRVPIGLSLAMGVAVARALEKVGAGETALKWPNDILLRGRKLGGILVELVSGTPHAAVIGIGLNRRLPAALPPEVRAIAAALDEACVVSGETLLAALLIELHVALRAFAADGFAVLRADWLARHAYQDAPVMLLADFAPPRQGICRGVNEEGALLLEVGGRVERVLSGEISLRPLPAPLST